MLMHAFSSFVRIEAEKDGRLHGLFSHMVYLLYPQISCAHWVGIFLYKLNLGEDVQSIPNAILAGLLLILARIKQFDRLPKILSTSRLRFG